MGHKRKSKPRKHRIPRTGRKKTDWNLICNIIQAAIAIYHVLFD